MTKIKVLVATYWNEAGKYCEMKRDDMKTKANFRFQLEANNCKVNDIYTKEEFEKWLEFIDKFADYSLSEAGNKKLFRKWLKENK